MAVGYKKIFLKRNITTMKNLSFFPAFVLLLSLFPRPSSVHAQQPCNNVKPPTFKVHLPLVTIPPDEEGQGWVRPNIWNYGNPTADSIVVPNGRPIYALIVSGFASNAYLDEMMLYNFARHLLAKGAYVHYSWWNNLLAPYMERPLHSLQSDPGSLTAGGLLNFVTAEAANGKGEPGEDYQFLSDAKLFLRAIRENNPNAIIIVAGHSMGGGAVVHLGTQTNELIDILAPIDPVGNRNYPWADIERQNEQDFNWTRWRVSRNNFLGYKKSYNAGTIVSPDCQPTGGWLPYIPTPTSDDPLCWTIFFRDNSSTVRFGTNIINLHHRYQQENLFPFDYDKSYHFIHFPRRQNSISTQEAVPMQASGPDPNGWPGFQPNRHCCPTEPGVAWGGDGHGEIVGYRGPTVPPPIPLGVRFITSPNCGSQCTGLTWPARSYSGGWINGAGAERAQRLMELESFSLHQHWQDAPTVPQLCKVSQGLINLFEAMNKPPTANAGNDQVVECIGQNGGLVTLNGSASTDPDGDQLEYTWTGPFGSQTGQVINVTLPIGTHCILLTVQDPSGHQDKKKIQVTVQDTQGPVINLSVSPNRLWPPNHKLINITATVSATDLCGTVESIVLHSIVASEGANVVGSGNTSPDIVGASYNTYDLAYQLRAERSGPNQRRVYTITYKATDNAGNSTFKSAEVIVENPSAVTQRSSEPEINEEVSKAYITSYPNPFSNITKFDYYLPMDGQVKLSIYNSLGQLVATPVHDMKQAGHYSVLFDAKELPSGIYSCVLRTSVNTLTHKILLLK
jgi:hypothetical protein